MSATQIIEEIKSLPREVRLEVMGRILAGESNEDVDAVLRQRRVAAFDEMCALIDGTDHPGKHMSEEEIIALASDEKLH